MQLANVKQMANATPANIAFNQTLIQKTVNSKANLTGSKTSKVLTPAESQSFNRFLEAYGDCV